MRRLLFIASLLALLLSACGSSAPPTPDLAQIQASAVAAASTMIAMTMQAMPTSTPVPTDTPTPQASPTALPTLPPLNFSTPTIPVAAGSTSGSDPCQAPLSPKATGPNARNVLIVNENKKPIILSLFLNKTPFGECGYRSFNIAAKQSISLSDFKVGCWEGGAFVGTTGPGISKAFTTGPMCITDTTQKWEIDVGPEVISLVPP